MDEIAAINPDTHIGIKFEMAHMRPSGICFPTIITTGLWKNLDPENMIC